MAASSFVAGHYIGTIGGVNFGTTRDGFMINETHHNEAIHTDEFGDVPPDYVQRGTQCDSVRFDYAEYPKVKAALYQQSGGAAQQGAANYVVGQLLSALAQPLILTPAGGTATGSTPWTFYLAIIDESFSTILATRLRQGPVLFRILPSTNGSTGVNYTPGS